jgi:broad specificity phosphatase PhoE
MNWDGEESLGAFLAEWGRATTDRAYVPRWGESSARVGERFNALLEELTHRHRGELVILVSHGGATVDLLRTLYGDEYVRKAADGIIDQGVPQCHLTHLRETDGLIEPVAIASDCLQDMSGGRPGRPIPRPRSEIERDAQGDGQEEHRQR